MVTPVHAPTPEDDPERTEQIPKVDSDSGSPQDPQPEVPTQSDGDDPQPRRRGRHRRPAKKQPLWRELLTLFAVALLLTFLIQHFLGRVYSIPSGSMEQTLHGCPGCTGDRVLVDKLIYTFGDPEPGDVVVFQGPEAWTENDVQSPKTGNVIFRA